MGLKNVFMTPKIEKVILNMGLGLDGADAKILKAAEEDIGKIIEVEKKVKAKPKKTTKAKKKVVSQKEVDDLFKL